MAIIHRSHNEFRKNLSAADGNTAQADRLEHTLFDETSRDIQNVLTEEQKELFQKKQRDLQQYSEDELKEEDGQD
jgi:hypothetical protein